AGRDRSRAITAHSFAMPARLQARSKRKPTDCASVRQPARLLFLLLLAGGVLLPMYQPLAAEEETFSIPDSQLEPLQWSDLDGWASDDLSAAFATLKASCQLLAKAKHPPDPRPIGRALWETCRPAVDMRIENSQAARTFFEENFSPLRIAKLGEADGFLTGYFEPIVQGSRFPGPEFHIPLYRRPRDLVALGATLTPGGFPNKGARIGRRNANN